MGHLPEREAAPASSELHGTVEAARAAEEAIGDESAQRLPVSNEVVLHGHIKMVSALSVDRSGARVVTGGMDNNVCIYDFNGMKADCKPFRELQPHEGHPVNAVSYSPSGESFLCVTGEARAKVRPLQLCNLSVHQHLTSDSSAMPRQLCDCGSFLQVYGRDGHEQGEFKRGGHVPARHEKHQRPHFGLPVRPVAPR